MGQLGSGGEDGRALQRAPHAPFRLEPKLFTNEVVDEGCRALVA